MKNPSEKCNFLTVRLPAVDSNKVFIIGAERQVNSTALPAMEEKWEIKLHRKMCMALFSVCKKVNAHLKQIETYLKGEREFYR